jgi:putative aldouronate transport system permease protein
MTFTGVVIVNAMKETLRSTGLQGKELAARLRAEKWADAKRMKLLYLFAAVPIGFLVIFHYIPLYGVVIAFKDFSFRKGILRSDWNNFYHFVRFFSTPYIYRILRNTIVISLLRLIFGFPAPIIFAILLNELGNLRFKKVVQSLSYLPHFMSWVVLSGILIEILSPSRGLVGFIYSALGRGEAPLLLMKASAFRSILVISGIWQGIGWGSIIYLAALAGIDPFLYEAATVDGAGRFRMAIHITIPSLIPVMTILLILSLGRILNAGFQQIFNLYNPAVYEVADIIDTYVYRVGLLGREYGFAAAAGLFKNVIGFILVFGTNAVIRKFSDYGIW